MNMIVTGWNNGSPNNQTGAGYGIRVSKGDRDLYFKREWDEVEIELEDERILVNISGSFWGMCSELRSSKIGKWMLKKGYAPWPKGNAPKFKLIPISGNRFKLCELHL